MSPAGSTQQRPKPPPTHTPLPTHAQCMCTRTQAPAQEGGRCRKEAGWNYFNFICGSKLARIRKAGCHTAALAGCGGRVKCRCRNGCKV